jgi:thiazole/oxazole-forming peptide maturase SagD family component
MNIAQALDAYHRAMPRGELHLFRIDALDRLGVPVTVANLRVGDGPHDVTFGNGYGATEDEARVGAMGELAEDTFSELAMLRMPRVHGSYTTLVRARGPSAVVDPLTLGLPAGSPYHPEMPLVWVEMQRLSTGEPVLVPEEFVAIYPGQLQGRTPLITAITNGQGAGLTRQQALAHGLLELLQRDGNGLGFRAMDRGVVLDLESTQLAPDVKALLERYRQAGVEVMAKLASTDFGMVNVYVVGRDPNPAHPLMLTACGEAVDPDRDRALRKALLEYAGSRARKAFSHGLLSDVARVASRDYMDRIVAHVDPDVEEPRALHAMAEWAQLPTATLRELTAVTLSQQETVRFGDLPRVPAVDDPALRYEHVLRHLRAEGFDILVADLSPPDHSVHVVKVLVPGLEVETLSYHRIGERNVARLLKRRDPLVGLGTPPPGAQPVRLTTEAELRLGGPVWFDARLADERMGQLYPLYREPTAHALPALLSRRRFGGG